MKEFDRELVVEQIKTIAQTGLTNMFDANNVLEIARAYDFNELIELIESDIKTYSQIILHG